MPRSLRIVLTQIDDDTGSGYNLISSPNSFQLNNNNDDNNNDASSTSGNKNFGNSSRIQDAWLIEHDVFAVDAHSISQQPDEANNDVTNNMTHRAIRTKRNARYGKYRRKTNADHINYHHNAVIKRGNARRSRGRSPRADDTSRPAVVDLLVYVDYSAYQQALQRNNDDPVAAAQSLQDYYRLLVTLMNTRYQEIDHPDININIRPAHIVIAKDLASSAFVEEVSREWRNEEGEVERIIDPQEALDSLHTWLLEQQHTLPRHDHVMAFIGYRMVRREQTSTSSGMAYVNTICQTKLAYSCSVIQETWGFGNVGAAAHELAHSLGAKHDGSAGNEACLAGHGYIMAPSSSPQDNYEHNFFSFSPCSIRAIHTTINSDQASCLYDSRPAKQPSTKPADLLDPHTQCQQVFGPHSGQCRLSGVGHAEDVCSRLWCSTRVAGGGWGCTARGGLHAVYGAPCGKNKICYNGGCLHESSIPIKQHATSIEQHQEVLHQQYTDTQTISQHKTDSNSHKNANIHITEEDNNSADKSVVVEPLEATRPSLEESVLQQWKNQHQHRLHKSSWFSSLRDRTTPPVPTTTATRSTTIIATTTEKTAKMMVADDIIRCSGDKNERYCRSVYYQHHNACAHAHIRDYCCYTCSFSG